MKQFIDFNHIEPKHQATHDRLINWASWYRDSKSAGTSPMFRGYKSKWRQWHTPDIKIVADGKDAQRIEKIVTRLPVDSRKALVWFYMANESILKGRRRFNKTEQELHELINHARNMVFIAVS